MQQPTLWNVLSRRWRDSRSRKSPFGAVHEIASDFWELVKESTPERRRALFGDVEYDWDHHVNTTSGAVSHRTRMLAALAGAPYQPTEPTVFAEMIRALEINYAEFTFIDIGSGKGRTLLMAAAWPFRHIIGVELLPELHEVAIGNISKSGQSTRVESICLDGRDYHFPSGPLVLYLFNPMPATALQQTIENLRLALEEESRPIRVIYHNPVSEDVLSKATFLTKIASTYQYAIYSN